MPGHCKAWTSRQIHFHLRLLWFGRSRDTRDDCRQLGDFPKSVLGNQCSGMHFTRAQRWRRGGRQREQPHNPGYKPSTVSKMYEEWKQNGISRLAQPFQCYYNKITLRSVTFLGSQCPWCLSNLSIASLGQKTPNGSVIILIV